MYNYKSYIYYDVNIYKTNMTCELPDILEVAGLDYLKKLLHTLYHVSYYIVCLQRDTQREILLVF